MARPSERQRLNKLQKEMKHADAKEGFHRKKRRVITVTLVWLSAILGLLVLSVLVGVFALTVTGKNKIFHKVEGQIPILSEELMQDEEIGEMAATEEKTRVWKEGWVRYQGKVYEYNTEVLTFLMLGIDDMGKVKKSTDGVSGGQSDAIFLVVANGNTKEISLVAVNRDTMVDVIMPARKEGEADKVITAQLASQHGFGDGMELSCELTRDAVSKVFFDLPIHGYVSFNMGGVAALNDALGGVEITVLESFTSKRKKWVEGTQMTLNGDDAWDYIHYRDTEVFESARNRLNRQKQYLSIMGKTALKKVKQDFTLPLTLYQSFKPYMVTDLTSSEITWLATGLVQYEFDGEQIYFMDGETKEGEKFEEFYPDKKAMKELMMKLFYMEVNPEEYL